MKIFKELNKLGYKHYAEYTIEELDSLPLNSEKRIMEQSLALRWFREKYNLHFYSFEANIPYPDDDYPNKVWVGKINDNCVNTQNGLAINHFHTYEEAELACLKKLIEIVKNK